MGPQVPLSLAQRNLQANEDAYDAGSEETPTRANQGKGITGSKERNWESWVVCCLCAATAVAS